MAALFSNGGLDGDGYAFSSELLSQNRVLNGTVFAFGSTGKLNAIYGTGQTIPLPSGKYRTLQLLATGLNGAQTGQSITVTYIDGSKSIFTQTFSDWYVPGPNVNEQEAIAMAYRDTATGKRDGRQFNAYGYTFILDRTKTVKSVTLPSNRSVVVLAVSLGTQALGTPVSLASAFNEIGIHTDGQSYSDAGIDGGGYSYSANLLNDTSTVPVTVAVGDAGYTLNPPDVPNAVSATGQTIAVPKGHYLSLRLLGTGLQGGATSQPIVVHYSDGTSQTFSQGFSDWYSFSGFTDESIGVATAYRDYMDGSQDDRTFNIYSYQQLLDPLKTVVSITLPNNSNVAILGVTLMPIDNLLAFGCYL